MTELNSTPVAADGLVEVTLDITGFFFEEKVRVAPNSSVKDVMEAVVTKTAETGREFRFHSAGKGPQYGREGNFSEFLAEISVTFSDKDNPPKSRQKHRTGISLPLGKYRFNDSSNVVIEGSKKSFFSLVWQYYISDAHNVLLSGARENGIRIKVPFSKSNTDYEGESAIKFKEGDRIVWRLVAICTSETEPLGSHSGSVKTEA